MQKIPAFIHIPKCGADYFLSKSWSIFLDFLMSGQVIERKSILMKAHRLIVTNESEVPILTALVYDPLSSCKRGKPCYKKHENPNNQFVSYISYDLFLKEIETSMLKIFSVIIEPEGIGLIGKDFFRDIEAKNEIKFKYITTLRDPLKMMESFFFSILKRAKNTGETSYRSFSSYIKSKNAPYGWLIKRLNGDDSKKVTEKIYLEAVDLLSKIKISNLEEIDKMILDAYVDCHRINFENLNIRYKEEAINPKKYKLILSDKDKTLFEKRAKFDIKIYKKFILNK